MPVLQAMGGGEGWELWLFYTVNLVYSESGNMFSPEKEENIFTLNDIHNIYCYVKYFHCRKKLRSHIVLPALLFTKIPLRSKGVHVFPSLWTFGAEGMLLKILTPFCLKLGMDFNYLGPLKVTEILVKDFLTHV